MEKIIQSVNFSAIGKIIILTKEKERVNKTIAMMHSKKILVMKDKKQALNASLDFLLHKLYKKRNNHNKRILIIMPDVPALNKDIIKHFVSSTKSNQLGIYPLEREGTAMVLIPKKFIPKITPSFGERSFNKFKINATKSNIEVHSFLSSDREMLRDIDTYQQLQTWLSAKEEINQKESDLKKAVKQLFERNEKEIVL